MIYYAIIENGIITQYAEERSILEPLNKPLVEIDYEPLWFKGIGYTKEKFAEIQASKEYKSEKEAENLACFDYESKQLEEQSSYIEYKGKKFSLEEILFKSLIYNSVTDLYVYLKAEDKSLVKVLRATFLLIVAKAKSNLKDVEEALYNASYDKTKSLDDNIKAIKNIFNAIDKIFNG